MGQILRLRRQAVFAQYDKLGGVTLLHGDDSYKGILSE